MMGTMTKVCVGSVLVWVGLLALPAGADWLVMQDGARVETKGPWKVKGASVVFTLPNGTLSSVRVSEVDLDASSLATAEARQPKQAPQMPPPAKRQPALVLTDKDIPRAAPLPAAPATPGEVVAPPAAAGQETRLQLEVTSWNAIENTEIDGLEIVGEVQNAGEDLAFAVAVAVTLTVASEEGPREVSAEGFVAEKSLAPRTRAGFRVLFPGVYELAGEPKFELTARNIRIGLPGAEPASESEEEGEDSAEETLETGSGEG